MQRKRIVDACLGQHHPVKIVGIPLKRKARPQAFLAVDGAGKAGCLAETEFHLTPEELVEAIVRQWNYPVLRLCRNEVDAFPFGEFEQQVASFLGGGRNQRGVSNVDGAGRQFREVAGARLSFREAEQRSPDADGGEDDDTKSQKGTDQQRPRSQIHFSLPSGTKT